VKKKPPLFTNDQARTLQLYKSWETKMPDWKSVMEAFWDGFAPLDSLFFKTTRPGSQRNLIASPSQSELFTLDVDASRVNTEATALTSPAKGRAH
jgi:hypothetical protein